MGGERGGVGELGGGDGGGAKSGVGEEGWEGVDERAVVEARSRDAGWWGRVWFGGCRGEPRWCSGRAGKLSRLGESMEQSRHGEKRKLEGFSDTQVL